MKYWCGMTLSRFMLAYLRTGKTGSYAKDYCNECGGGAITECSARRFQSSLAFSDLDSEDEDFSINVVVLSKR